jgi:hypothetical protein
VVFIGNVSSTRASTNFTDYSTNQELSASPSKFRPVTVRKELCAIWVQFVGAEIVVAHKLRSV